MLAPLRGRGTPSVLFGGAVLIASSKRTSACADEAAAMTSANTHPDPFIIELPLSIAFKATVTARQVEPQGTLFRFLS
jgi:hypothetical protein